MRTIHSHWLLSARLGTLTPWSKGTSGASQEVAKHSTVPQAAAKAIDYLRYHESNTRPRAPERYCLTEPTRAIFQGGTGTGANRRCLRYGARYARGAESSRGARHPECSMYFEFSCPMSSTTRRIRPHTPVRGARGRELIPGGHLAVAHPPAYQHRNSLLHAYTYTHASSDKAGKTLELRYLYPDAPSAAQLRVRNPSSALPPTYNRVRLLTVHGAAP